jgi:hypothetical protein
MQAVSRSSAVWCLALGVLACDGTSSVNGKSGSGKTPSSGGKGATAVTQPGTFQVTRDADLEAPLQVAFEQARDQRLTTFTVVLAPGTYERPIDLTDPRDERRLALVVASAGPGPAILSGGVKLDGAAATLRDVVIEGAQRSAAVVALRVETAAALERVAVLGSAVADRQADDAVVVVHAARDRARALVKDCWFLQNRSASGRGAALDFDADAGKAFEAITLDNVAFAGNQVPYSLRPRYAARAELRGALFHEAAVTQAMIYLNSPMVKLSLEGGAIAGGRRVLAYMINDDAKRSDYLTATMRGTRLALGAPLPADDFAQSEVTLAPAAAAGQRWEAATAAARRGAPPSAALLGL